MSFECMTWAVKQRTGKGTNKAVLMALANRTNHETGMCRPRIKLIAMDVEFSEDTVKKALKELAEAGFLKVVPRFLEGQQLANDYQLMMEGGQQQGVGADSTPGGCPQPPGWVPTATPCNQEVETGSSEPVLPKLKASIEEEALKVYEKYPMKVGRAVALKSIEKALRKIGADELTEAVEEFAAAVGEWPKEDREKYIPNPATWFNQERWTDDRSSWRRKAASKEPTQGQTAAAEMAQRKRLMAVQLENDWKRARAAYNNWFRMYGAESVETKQKLETVTRLEAEIRRLGFEPGRVNP